MAAVEEEEEDDPADERVIVAKERPFLWLVVKRKGGKQQFTYEELADCVVVKRPPAGDAQSRSKNSQAVSEWCSVPDVYEIVARCSVATKVVVESTMITP